MDTKNIILERRNIADLTAAVVAHQDAKSRRMAIKVDTLTHYGNGRLACVKCGFSDFRALCLDHIKGSRELGSRPAYGGSVLYRQLRNRNYPSGYQTLCYNCNAVKAYTDNGWYK